MNTRDVIEEITKKLVEQKKLELLNEVSMEQVMLQFDSKKMKKAVARNEEWDLQKVERWLKTPRFQELFQNFIPTDIQENEYAEGLQWILGLYKKGKLGSIRSWSKSLTEKHSAALELFFQQKPFMEEKRKGEKYQIHFGSDQFMDEEDDDVSDSKKVELISLIKPAKEAFGQDIQKNLSKYVYKKFDDGREFIQDPTLKVWSLNGVRHREDGPAVEHTSGTKEWWLNGVRHREDGPAIEFIDGSKAWYLNDKQVKPF